jgi:Rrf2 family iron-sulfur cluster assembly transcriptional regulator
MVDVALHEERGPVLRREIAERQEISSHYLAQLFGKLRRAGLVESVLGPGGGYVLARSAAEISAGDVLRAVDESLSPVACVDSEQEPTCRRVDGCSTHFLWMRLGEAVAQVLDSTTVAELCAPSRQAMDKEQGTTSYAERKETNA